MPVPCFQRMACRERPGPWPWLRIQSDRPPQQSRNLLASNKRRPHFAWYVSEDDPPKDFPVPIQASLPRCEMHGPAAAAVRIATVSHPSTLTKGSLKTA